ncbi:MAG: hypothetical protein JNL97_15010 [Verrucomicrobiales bacterium]|nr:hypothetical protein [Verrucomicrobiales bacterium]
MQIANLTLAPAEGPPGSAVRARGVLTKAAAVEVRLYWEQAGNMRILGRGRSALDGTFDLGISVPTETTVGAARVAALVEGRGTEDLAGAAFEVLASAPGRVRGVVRNSAGQSVGSGIGVRLLGTDGLPRSATVTDAAGRFDFAAAPPGQHQVQIMLDGYAPAGVAVASNGDLALTFDPANVFLPELPPVRLMGAGAVALPGGAYVGKEPVKVGDWVDVPMTRLVSIKDKGLAPLQVRFWAEINKITLPSEAPLLIVLDLRKGGNSVVSPVVTTTRQTIFPSGTLDVPAFVADFNSFELPPGKLSFLIAAFTYGFEEVGRWEFPVEVVDLGSRWYSGRVKSPKLTVTRQDFFQLRYAFEGTLPNLPGLGTPLFKDDLKIKSLTLKNEFHLGIDLKERFFTGGAWEGQAKALARLTLLSAHVLDESKPLARSGSSLSSSKYAFAKPWTTNLGPEICVPLVGVALPKPIELCGLKFGGFVGVQACVGGEVSFDAHTESDLRLVATVTPSLKLAVPIGAELHVAVCRAEATIRPNLAIQAPIRLDPSHTPPVYWDGLCLKIGTKADFSLLCCDDVGFGSVDIDLFEPFVVPQGCGAGGQRQALAETSVESHRAPPRHASIAYSPAGYALAVWDHRERSADGSWVHIGPVQSLFDGTRWHEPRPLAGPGFVGWEPQVGFLDHRRALVVWSEPVGPAGRSDSVSSGPKLQGLDCSLVEPILDIGCAVLSTGVKVVGTVLDSVCGWFGCAEAGLQNVTAQGVDPRISSEVISDGATWNLRPVLATDSRTGAAVLLWLRDQTFDPDAQKAFGLYASRWEDGRWTLPERVDPASVASDLLPSVRFDPRGRPAAVWVRDLDGDMDTAEDRTLVFSLFDGGWSPPETLSPLPAGPWTPSLDFDSTGQPIVAFVVAPPDPESGIVRGGDGTLSTLHVARRLGSKWVAHAVGEGVRAERPVVRVRPDDQALVFFRGFGTAGRSQSAGTIASAVADLGDSEPRWAIGPLTADGYMDSAAAAELNPTNGVPLVLWESRDPEDSSAEPELRGRVEAWLPDLVVDEAGITFSRSHPTPREPVELSVRVVNRGLRPVADGGFRVAFYDREPGRGVEPFATQDFRGPLGFGAETLVVAAFTPADRAVRSFHVVVDGGDAVPESNEANNRAIASWGGLAAPMEVDAAPVQGRGQVRLSWTNPVADGSARHWIRRTAVRTGKEELIGATFGEAFTDSEAVPGEDYVYRIWAEDLEGNRSTAATLPPTATAPVPPPDSQDLRLHVVSYRDRMMLSWNAMPAVRLQSADELRGPETRWTVVGEDLERLGSIAQITLPAVKGRRFFRLAWLAESRTRDSVRSKAAHQTFPVAPPTPP